ncbi:Acetyl esterase/lipase [Cyclobacterium xiamenense]|uniref:Acetyl esterase/lipase n=1 Tax=Cyclobacterium xiamenense TaxID=1297121 RepID=A0A1H6W423_9BACT|nr:alpha/beta hydrolase [Cyclobacterium xiamenense]SEJ07272.1 Acetyl esterase/lipase [Cyclobacterium xiamenense]
MRSLLLLTCLLMLTNLSMGQTGPLTLTIYPGEVPFQKETDITEVVQQNDILVISKVQLPQIQVFLPAKRSATGKAVIICPGGGYGVLAYDWEGLDIAKWLNSHGIAAIVLKYRLPSAATQTRPHVVPMSDGQRAIRLVRHHAEEWGIDPDQIGIMGFSAGGHLASTLGTHFDSGNPGDADAVEHQSSRPDFMVLGYPVISFTEHITHIGSRNNLLGKEPDPQWVSYFSNETQVRADSPPTFLFHSQDDKAVPVEHSLLMYQGLLEKQIPVEMHLYPTGGHGFSLSINKEGTQKGWMESLITWIQHLPTSP